MKRLLGAIIVATLAYSGWWVYASNALRTDVADWFEQQQAAGLEARYADLTVRGFPNRTDLTLTSPVLRAPDNGFGWQAPFVQVLGLTYKQGHVIVAWPDSQTVTTPQGEIALSSDGLRASVIHDGGTLIRTNLEATVLNFEGPDQSLALADVNAAVHRIEPSPDTYRVALSVGSIATRTPGIGPDSMASLRAEMDLALDRPLTFDLFESSTPQPTRITLHRSELSYGGVTFKLTGDAELDAQGRASGEVHVSAENWRDAIAAAQASGDLPPGLGDGLIDLLGMLATFGGSRDALDVTLGLDKGRVLLGPLPIGTVPPLVWR